MVNFTGTADNDEQFQNEYLEKSAQLLMKLMLLISSPLINVISES